MVRSSDHQIVLAHFGATIHKNSVNFRQPSNRKKRIIVPAKFTPRRSAPASAPGSARFNHHKGALMLSKCANPECSSKFRYLHDGKVFRVEPDAFTHSSKPPRNELSVVVPARVLIAQKPAGRPEYFWLCSTCCEHSTIGTDSRGVVLVPVCRQAHAVFPTAAVKAAAA